MLNPCIIIVIVKVAYSIFGCLCIASWRDWDINQSLMDTFVDSGKNLKDRLVNSLRMRWRLSLRKVANILAA